MKITDITPDDEPLYYCCLEEWSDEMKEAGDYKARWYSRMKAKGARVKFARDDKGIIGGMIQYIPIEHTAFAGKNLWVILCIWVHGHKKGRGDYRKQGMGSALIKAVEEDCKKHGVDGVVAWGLAIPAFMRASWFKRKGYKVVDKQGIIRLLFKPCKMNVLPPKFIRPDKFPSKSDDKVNVSMFVNGWCPAQNIAYQRVKQAARLFPGKIDLYEYDCLLPDVRAEWGVLDGLYIDGKEMKTGPPPSFNKIKRKLARSVKKL